MTIKHEVLITITNLIVKLHELARIMEKINHPLSINIRQTAHELTVIENNIRSSKQ